MSKPKFRKPFERLSNVDSAQIIEVIKVESIVGEGDGVGSPIRQIREYFTLDGLLITRQDSYLDKSLEIGIWNHDKDKE